MPPHTHHFKASPAVSVASFTLALCSILFPEFAWADGFTGTEEKLCGFFTNINKLLNLASVTVVTIAIILSGYQIAFAHKRIADVAPILIGGMLIGAAAQVAKMLIGDEAGECSAAIVRSLSNYA